MYSKILILRFPHTVVREPIVCDLVKKFDLTFTILNAAIFPRKEGKMVLELSGSKSGFKQGVKYLREHHIHVQNAAQDVEMDEKKCTQCGACTAVCPTNALSIQRPEMTVVFNRQKCSVCELCVPACPTRAMSVKPSSQSFF
ncbi:(Fe-S)-binding protein [Candidatus Desulfarcum epimagneticum]|uniref:(Fe-S)-binding protein n=1 Tax=uncultured Desulfobacteraceae bacterium TaxID=218296 RepID=A0A484HDI9_9BACT|nr:(Fe-S)-binding protein [uncultured Desulfobacteraceae bacterium]